MVSIGSISISALGDSHLFEFARGNQNACFERAHAFVICIYGAGKRAAHFCPMPAHIDQTLIEIFAEIMQLFDMAREVFLLPPIRYRSRRAIRVVGVAMITFCSAPTSMSEGSYSKAVLKNVSAGRKRTDEFRGGMETFPVSLFAEQRNMVRAPGAHVLSACFLFPVHR